MSKNRTLTQATLEKDGSWKDISLYIQFAYQDTRYPNRWRGYIGIVPESVQDKFDIRRGDVINLVPGYRPIHGKDKIRTQDGKLAVFTYGMPIKSPWFKHPKPLMPPRKPKMAIVPKMDAVTAMRSPAPPAAAINTILTTGIKSFLTIIISEATKFMKVVENIEKVMEE